MGNFAGSFNFRQLIFTAQLFVCLFFTQTKYHKISLLQEGRQKNMDFFLARSRLAGLENWRRRLKCVRIGAKLPP